jgi:hypothetical protein
MTGLVTPQYYQNQYCGATAMTAIGTFATLSECPQ